MGVYGCMCMGGHTSMGMVKSQKVETASSWAKRVLNDNPTINTRLPSDPVELSVNLLNQLLKIYKTAQINLQVLENKTQYRDFITSSEDYKIFEYSSAALKTVLPSPFPSPFPFLLPLSLLLFPSIFPSPSSFPFPLPFYFSFLPVSFLLSSSSAFPLASPFPFPFPFPPSFIISLPVSSLSRILFPSFACYWEKGEGRRGGQPFYQSAQANSKGLASPIYFPNNLYL